MAIKRQLIAALCGIAAGVALTFEPLAAANCFPVTTKEKAQNGEAAATLAYAELGKKAKSMGGRVGQGTLNCVPKNKEVLCTVTAPVCND